MLTSTSNRVDHHSSAGANLMGLVFQTDSALLGSDNSTNWCCNVFIRFLLFILAPFLPIIVIMKAIELKGKKEELEAMYRDISIDATAKWERIREVDEDEQEVIEALSDLKMVECSTEAVVQFLLLIIFTFASVLLPTTSGLTIHFSRRTTALNGPSCFSHSSQPL